MWEEFPNYFSLFFSSGAYNMAKKYFENNGKKGENSLIGRVGGGGPPHGNFSHIIPFFSDHVPNGSQQGA